VDALELFLREHAIAHSAQVAAGEQRSSEDFILRHLDEAQMRARPHGLNSLAWLVWHMARSEDVGINVVIAGQRQVFDEGDWAARLNVTRRDVGTGMSADEVAELSEQIRIPELRLYRAAVGRRTREVVAALPPAAWGEIVEAAETARARSQGAYGPGAEWLERFCTGKSKAWYFYWIAVGHNHLHLGQARWVRKLLLGKGQV